MNKKIIAGVFALAFMSISASAFAEATTMPATGAPKMNEKMETSKDKADGKVDAKDAKGNDIETKDDVAKPKKVMPKKQMTKKHKKAKMMNSSVTPAVVPQ